MARHLRKRRADKKKVSLNRRLYSIVAAILLLVMSTIITATYEGLDMVYLFYNGIQCFYAAREVETAYAENRADFFEYLDSVEKNYELMVEIYDEADRFVYSSDYKGEMSPPPYGRDSIVLSDEVRKDFTVETDLGETINISFAICSDNLGGRNLHYLKLKWVTASGGSVVLYKLRSDADTTSRLAVAFISIVTIIVLFIALIIIIVFIRHTTKPLVRMSEVTQNMAKLDFSTKAVGSSVQEISVLADSINEMSDSLESSLADLQQKNEKLQKDIEQERTIEQLRELFISGMSHELKTPIAIIQGYAEGLGVFIDEGDLDTAKKYSDTIITETERMNDLVLKLLEISRYESGAYETFFEDFDMSELTEEWLARNRGKLADAGIEAIDDIPSGTYVRGDKTLLASVVNNYLSNAVAHVSGEKKIRISMTDNGDTYTFEVFNTGNPIAEKDIDKIWDSFYRADKSLSRSQGRFGLGLAVVAAIQKQHDMPYGVRNTPEGPVFTFDTAKAEQPQADNSVV